PDQAEDPLTPRPPPPPTPVSRLLPRAPRPRLDHTAEDIHIHLRCLCHQESLAHLLIQQLLPLRLRLREPRHHLCVLSSQTPLSQRPLRQRQPLPQISGQQLRRAARRPPPVSVHLPPLGERRSEERRVGKE